MEWLAVKALLSSAGAFLKRIPWQVYAALAVVLLLWALYAFGVHAGRAQVQTKFDAYRAEVIANTAIAKQRAAAKEAQDRAAFAAIEKRWNEERADAKRKADRLAADLRAGRERLRREWTCPAGSAGTAAGFPGADEAARVREKGASDLVGAAAEADAWIRALQAIIRAERKPLPP